MCCADLSGNLSEVTNMATNIEWVLRVLDTTAERWVKLADTVPTDLITLLPLPSEWSAAECLQHLVETEREVFPVRLRCLLAGEDFPGFDPDAQGTRPDAAAGAQALAREFRRMREESLTALRGVSTGDLGRTAQHAELGVVSLEEMLNEWAAHDLMHTVQGERALMQPFIAGSGPWQWYFADHVAKG